MTHNDWTLSGRTMAGTCSRLILPSLSKHGNHTFHYPLNPWSKRNMRHVVRLGGSLFAEPPRILYGFLPCIDPVDIDVALYLVVYRANAATLRSCDRAGKKNNSPFISKELLFPQVLKLWNAAMFLDSYLTGHICFFALGICLSFILQVATGTLHSPHSPFPQQKNTGAWGVFSPPTAPSTASFDRSGRRFRRMRRVLAWFWSIQRRVAEWPSLKPPKGRWWKPPNDVGSGWSSHRSSSRGSHMVTWSSQPEGVESWDPVVTWRPRVVWLAPTTGVDATFGHPDYLRSAPIQSF